MVATLLLSLSAGLTSPVAMHSFGSTSKASAASQAMYTYWCEEKGHGEDGICKRHALAAKLRTAAPEEKSALLVVLKSISSKSSSKDYLAMKSAYCADAGATSKSFVCDSPSSAYGNRSLDKSDPSRREMMEWYCSKPAEQDSTICKRWRITSQMIPRPGQPPVTAERRKELFGQIRELGSVPIGLTQAVTAQFCRIPANVAKAVCLSEKKTEQAKEMQKWYCGKSPDEAFCKRQMLLEKLRALPSSDPNRQGLMSQLVKATKSTGGKSISAGYAQAKSEFCQQPGKAHYSMCTSLPPLPA